MSFVSMFPSLVTWDIPWIVVVRNKRKWTTLSNTKENIFQCKRTFLGFYILKLYCICAKIFWVQERNLKQRICFIKASFISKCYNNIKTSKTSILMISQWNHKDVIRINEYELRTYSRPNLLGHIICCALR